MKKYLLAAGVACVFALAAQAPTAAAEVPLTINAGYGYWRFDRDRSVDDDGTPWLSLEWAFSDQLATEFMYTYGEADGDRGDSVDISSYQLGLLFYSGSYIGEPNRVRPYLTLGMGKLDFDGHTADSGESNFYGGVGVRWMLTRALGLRLESRGLRGFDEHDVDFLFSAGLNYYFGKTTEDQAAGAAATAGGGVASGDEDGDGVVDLDDRCPGTPAGTRVDSVGCPLPVTRVASIKMMVNFGFDSAKVEERYFHDIGELAAFLKRFQDVYVDIEGHTDSTGPEDYNQKLSQRRAQAVVDMLVNEYGIDARRLEPKGYGESQPVADNSTREGRAQNRRVMATLEVEYEE